MESKDTIKKTDSDDESRDEPLELPVEWLDENFRPTDRAKTEIEGNSVEEYLRQCDNPDGIMKSMIISSVRGWVDVDIDKEWDEAVENGLIVKSGKKSGRFDLWISKNAEY